MQPGNPVNPLNPFDENLGSQWEAPKRPSSFALLLIILGGGCFCFLLCAGGGAVWVARQNSPSAPTAPTETLQEKIAASTTAYASDEVGVEHKTLHQIERLMTRVKRAARDNDDAAFQELVDFDGVVDYIRQSEHAARANFATLMTLKYQMPNATYVDQAWHKISIRRVEPIAGTNHFLAYTHCYDINDGLMEVRFWLSNQKGDWKIVDWERMDLGMRHSTEWALYAVYADDRRLEDYFDVLEDLQIVDESPDEDATERAKRTLRLAATRRVPPEFHDIFWVQIGYQWNWYGELDEAIRCFDRVKNADATPGAYFGKAVSFGSKEQYAEAVDSMSRYEAVIGPAPDASRFKAGWLAELERHAEEAAEWKQVLRFEPDDAAALRSLAGLLDVSEIDTLINCLQRTSKPLERAERLAGTSSYQRNHAAFDAIEKYVSETAAESATAAYIAGLRLQDADELEEAAVKFREAIKLAGTDEQKARHRYVYLDTLVEANQVVAAYNSVDDQQAAFEYLLGSYEEGDIELTEEEVEALLAAHREKYPRDAYAAYVAGFRLVKDERLDDAVAVLADGIKQAADDDRSADICKYQLDFALCSSGKCLEAYRASDMSSERFSTLASVCRTQRRWEDLRALLAEHRTQHANDSALTFYEAVLFVSEENLEGAQDLLAKLAEDESDEPAVYPYQLNRLNAHPSLWEAAYDGASDPDDVKPMFQVLASTFAHQGRYEELKSLVAKHRTRFPDDVATARWHKSLLVSDEDEAEFANVWFPKRDRFFEEEYFSWQTQDAAQQLVRVLLKTGRKDDALELAVRIKEEQQDLLPLILCHSAAGNIEETRNLIEERLAGDRTVDDLFDDEEMGPLLRSSAYAELRAEHPFTIPYSISENNVALLLKQLPEWDVAALQTMLSGLAGGPVTVTSLRNNVTASSQFVVASGDARLVIGLHEGKYTSPERVDLPSEPLRAALDEHQAWVSLAGIRWARPKGQSDSRELVRDAAMHLLDESCLAIWLVDQYRLLHNNEADRSAWSAAANALEQAQLAEHLNLYRNPAPTDIVGQRAVTRAVRRLLRACENRAEDDQFTLAIDLEAGLASERLWMTLEKLEGEAYYPRYVGRLMHDSLLVPALQAGERCQIEEYAIAALRFEHGGQTVEAETGKTARND
jgi:hypothetical protein